MNFTEFLLYSCFPITCCCFPLYHGNNILLPLALPSCCHLSSPLQSVK